MTCAVCSPCGAVPVGLQQAGAPVSQSRFAPFRATLDRLAQEQGFDDGRALLQGRLPRTKARRYFEKWWSNQPIKNLPTGVHLLTLATGFERLVDELLVGLDARYDSMRQQRHDALCAQKLSVHEVPSDDPSGRELVTLSSPNSIPEVPPMFRDPFTYLSRLDLDALRLIQRTIDTEIRHRLDTAHRRPLRDRGDSSEHG